jgi:hypothetical protein
MMVGALAVVPSLSQVVSAQRSEDARLARLDSTTRVAVVVVLDSARKSRLPTEPIIDKSVGIREDRFAVLRSKALSDQKDIEREQQKAQPQQQPPPASKR